MNKSRLEELRCSAFCYESLEHLWPGPVSGPLTAICAQADSEESVRILSECQVYGRNQDYATFKKEIVYCMTYAIVQEILVFGGVMDYGKTAGGPGVDLSFTARTRKANIQHD